jgi:DNA-binding NtrC family response regulator
MGSFTDHIKKKTPEPDHFRDWMLAASQPRAALLVDDSEPETMIVVQQSTDFNVQWEIAHTADKAIELISKKLYQLIVLDLQLGSNVSGVDIFRRVKRTCPMVPVLILSGHITNQAIVEITSIGFAMFAQKPTVFDSNFFEQLFMALGIPRIREGAARVEPKVIEGDNI